MFTDSSVQVNYLKQSQYGRSDNAEDSVESSIYLEGSTSSLLSGSVMESEKRSRPIVYHPNADQIDVNQSTFRIDNGGDSVVFTDAIAGGITGQQIGGIVVSVNNTRIKTTHGEKEQNATFNNTSFSQSQPVNPVSPSVATSLAFSDSNDDLLFIHDDEDDDDSSHVTPLKSISTRSNVIQMPTIIPSSMHISDTSEIE